MHMAFVRTCIATLILIFVLVGTAHAQSIDGDISIDTVPLNPTPGSTVTLTATSYAMDLNQANISWTYNNVVIAKGTGTTSVAVVAPAAGATGTIGITASGNGTSASGTLVLRPASIDLLWEAVDSYTHPFYKGKALLPVNGLIRYSVIPSASAPKGLSYNWSRNGSTLVAESGFGKSSLLIKHNEFNPQETVEVSIGGGSFAGAGMSRLSPLRTPQVIAYETRQGYIDYAHGYLSTIPFIEQGIVLHFEPYFFSIPRTVLADLTFDLKVDGESVSRPQANQIGLSRPDRRGQSILDLAITTVTYGLQHVEKTFTLLFN